MDSPQFQVEKIISYESKDVYYANKETWNAVTHIWWGKKTTETMLWRSELVTSK